MKTREPGLGARMSLDAIGAGGVSRRRRWPWLLLLAAAAGGAWWLLRSDAQPSAVRYQTEPASRGALVVTVSATGNLRPTNQVDVGSELSGIVVEVLVDENDSVEQGQVLARLDVSRLTDTVVDSEASLTAARAGVKQARAGVVEAEATVERLERVRALSGGKVPAQSELDTARAALARAEAAVATARASVKQAEARLQSDRTNLDKASIRSPIDGVVLTRSVEPGQTVAAALQAPVLFTLAQDLTQMELRVEVDEADVGRVEVGQRATFGVDAWPDRRYVGVITRVGFGATTTDGVVSYPAVLDVSNVDLSLRPGMTGTAEIEVARVDGALRVPNAALRFTPAPSGEGPPAGGRGVLGSLMPGPPRGPPKSRSVAASGGGGSPTVWALRGGRPTPVVVEAGLSDGRMTEVVAVTEGALDVGAALIVARLGPTP